MLKFLLAARKEFPHQLNWNHTSLDWYFITVIACPRLPWHGERVAIMRCSVRDNQFRSLMFWKYCWWCLVGTMLVWVCVVCETRVNANVVIWKSLRNEDILLWRAKVWPCFWKGRNLGHGVLQLNVHHVEYFYALHCYGKHIYQLAKLLCALTNLATKRSVGRRRLRFRTFDVFYHFVDESTIHVHCIWCRISNYRIILIIVWLVAINALKFLSGHIIISYSGTSVILYNLALWLVLGIRTTRELFRLCNKN